MTASKYLELAKIANSIEVEIPKSVRAANAAVDKMRALIVSAAESDTSSLSEYYPLLSNTESSRWLSHHLVETGGSPKEIEDKCFSIVETLAKEPNAHGLGEQYWLKEWRQKRGYV